MIWKFLKSTLTNNLLVDNRYKQRLKGHIQIIRKVNVSVFSWPNNMDKLKAFLFTVSSIHRSCDGLAGFLEFQRSLPRCQREPKDHRIYKELCIFQNLICSYSIILEVQFIGIFGKQIASTKNNQRTDRLC